MTSIEEILALKPRYVDELYSLTRKEQNTDKSYIDDTFTVGSVEEPHKVLRLGLGYEIVNAPADQIVTSNPQAFVEVFEDTVTARESGDRIAKYLNEQVIYTLKRQNPNPFKESVKNKGGRGVNHIRLSHNERWVLEPIDKTGMPVIFSVPDPMVVYASPEEDTEGRPLKVIIKYERQPSELILKYPGWVKKDEKKLVEWFEYIDKDTIYCEADGEQVKYIPNPYGIVPFTRKYSGFGRRSPDGELASLIVSDIRYSRGMIEEVCSMRSDIASVMHLSAHKPKNITSTGHINEEQIRTHYDPTGNAINILDELPPDFKMENEQMEQPTIEAFTHTANIMSELTRKHPFILAGFPIGENARQMGQAETAGMRRYDTVIENTELEWGTAFEMMFKILLPTMLPEGLKKEDLDTPFRCIVKLKAKDPIEEDRLGTLGSRYLQNKEIDPITNLVEFKGYTLERAKQIMTNVLMWDVLLESRDIRELIGLRAAEKAGMGEDLQMIKQRREAIEGGIQKEPPRTTKERIQGEANTALGRANPVEPNKGARRPPRNYTRGG